MLNTVTAELCHAGTVSIPLGTLELSARAEWNYNLASGTNRIYLCRACGHVWARLRFSDAKEWRAVTRACCEEHRTFADEKPASLITEPIDLLLLPKDALFRETLRALGLDYVRSR